MNRKLKLDLDDLKVESFVTTSEAAGPPGTVFGQDSADACTEWTSCGQTACTGNPECNTGGDNCTGGDPNYTHVGTGCGGGSGFCGLTLNTCSYNQTCWSTCNCGLTYGCITGSQTDCPGQTNCAPYTQDYTCDHSCTSQGCTYCDNVC